VAPPGYQLGEEIANSVTHGVGAVLAIAGSVVLVVMAALHGTVWHVVGCAVFGGTLVVLYTASTLYHSIPHARARSVLQVLDHTAIYLLIAGTYTPFMLVTLRGPWGWSLLGVVWAVAVAGISLHTTSLGRRMHILRVVLYIIMGWVGIVAFRPLVVTLGATGTGLVLAGGVAYTAGVAFYASKRRYSHAIWHVFVLAGSALHYTAVLLYVVP
jgi:hemolysin III